MYRSCSRVKGQAGCISHGFPRSFPLVGSMGTTSTQWIFSVQHGSSSKTRSSHALSRARSRTPAAHARDARHTTSKRSEYTTSAFQTSTPITSFHNHKEEPSSWHIDDFVKRDNVPKLELIEVRVLRGFHPVWYEGGIELISLFGKTGILNNEWMSKDKRY